MNYQSYLILLILGVLTGVSYSYIYLIPIIIISFSYLFSLIEKSKNQKNSFFIGWMFGTGFFLGSMHWIVFPFLVYEKHLLLSPVVLIVFPVSLGLFFSLPTLFLHNFLRKVNSDFLYFKCTSLSFIFLLSELIRSNIFGGLPFNLTAQIWAFNSEFINIVSFLGVYGLSFLTINWLVILSYLILEKKRSFFVFLLIFPIFLYNFDNFPFKKKSSLSNENINIRVIQPNIPQEDKWNKLKIPMHLEKLINLTNKDLNEEEEYLVVWPEVAIPFYLNEEKELEEYLRKEIKDNVVLITGALRREFSDNNFKIYNSLYLLNKDELFVYDKKKLVPFGEFVPLRKLLKFTKLTQGSTDFSKGLNKKRINLNIDGEIFFVEPSICYEAIFQSFVRYKPHLFVNITNDAWFGTTIGPKQHLAASIYRAIEKGTPLIRSANSGISVIANLNGKILKKIDLQKTGHIDVKLSTNNNETFFMKFKNYTLVLLISLLAIISLMSDIITNRKKN
ncbi:MAG: apolipoprotein N-acyltransferase [Rickettsiales bacterium]|nr:apolipoprotein N-acyltransferase [Rickettsiales bacterium]